MKNYLALTFLILFFYCFLYLVFSFVHMDFNALKWGFDARMGYAFMVVLGTWAIIGFYLTIEK